jgi:hypothetical protein
MIERPLAFVRDRHWRELSPEEGQWRYRFEYLLEVPHRLEKNLNLRAELRDQHGRPWVIIDGRWWLTQPLYRFNGCSPKWHVNLLGTGKPGWVGTPDVIGGPNGVGGNVLSAGWHDQARQFSRTDVIAEHFSVAEIDRGFHQLLKQCFFKQADLYYRGVRMAAGWWPHHEDGQHSVITSL